MPYTVELKLFAKYYSGFQIGIRERSIRRNAKVLLSHQNIEERH